MTAQLVEFRNYRIVPGGVDDFVEHFEARFLASQEELGMDIVGQFRVPGAERFVWVRRYLDPSVRAAALTSFYTGPVWKEFGPRANELLVDHTDVHLLVPDPTGPPLAADHVAHGERTGPPTGAASPSSVVAAVFDIAARDRIPPDVTEAMTATVSGALELGRLVTSSTPNNFPPLPVHEDAAVALWLLSDVDGGEAAIAAATEVADRCALPVRTITLAPTARSTLH